MKNNEYEIIYHNNSNFHIFIVNLLYRTPHMHKDFEIDLILNGSLILLSASKEISLKENDIFIINPYVSHEIKSNDSALIISLQVSPTFFAHYFPQIEDLEFDLSTLHMEQSPAIYQQIHTILFDLASAYYQKEDFAPVRCAPHQSAFLSLLNTGKYRLISQKEKAASLARQARMKKIVQYIDDHCKEKLLLSDIAVQTQLNLYYLSHFFKEAFGTSFQNYIAKLRCEHAQQLLLLTDYSLLDISLNCGFSDPKYFNKGFLEQYGCTPKDYRNNFRNAHLERYQGPRLCTQEILSEQERLVILERYREIKK